MSHIVLMVGLPASGKTTIAKSMDAKRVSRDDIDAMLGGEWSKELAFVHSAIEEHCITVLVQNGYNVVVDRTNLTKEVRSRFIRLANELECTISAVICTCSFETALKRNRARPHPVPEEAMERLLAKTELPTIDEILYDVINTEDLSSYF